MEITLPLYADLLTRKQIGPDGGTPDLPTLTLADEVTCKLWLYERTDGTLTQKNPNVRSLRASLGPVLAPPTSGTFKVRCVHSGNHDSAAIDFGASAAALKTALDAVTLSPLADVSLAAPCCWIFRLTDNSQALFGDAQEVKLDPAAFVRIRAFQRGAVWWHEIRLIQTPLAFTGLHDRVLPPPPSVARIQQGGSDSDAEDVEVNEIQALTLPADFRGTYVLKFDVRQTALLGIDDGPDEIAAALNAMWKDGATRFTVTNPEADKAYIEFVGQLADQPWDLITTEVRSFEPGVLTFLLDLATAELAAALRTVTTITVPLEIEIETVADGADPDDPDVPGKKTTISQDFTIRREQIYDELATVPAIDWLRPPNPKNYVPFTPDQIITGEQHFVAVRGDGAATTFVCDHGLNTDAIAGILVRGNTSGAVIYREGDDYEILFTDENSLSIHWLSAAPAANSLLVVITAAGPTSVFQAHTHTIGQIVDLTAELDTLKARLAAIEDLLPSVKPSAAASATSEPFTIEIPDLAQVVPGTFAADFDAEKAAKDGSGLPGRGRGLLPALHDSTVANAVLPLPSLSANAGSVFKNNTADPILLPGGLGRRSAQVLPNDFYGTDGRVWYRVNRDTQPSNTNSYFPTDFERQLFAFAVGSKMLRAAQRLTVEFDLALKTINADTNAQWLLLIEVGTVPAQSTPSPTGENLENVVWSATPLLSERIILSPILLAPKFGVSIARNTLGAFSADVLSFGRWEASEAVPTDANFALRARLAQFDTENSVSNARGFVFLKLSGASATITDLTTQGPGRFSDPDAALGFVKLETTFVFFGEAVASQLFGNNTAANAQRVTALELDAQDAPTGHDLTVELVNGAGASFSPPATVTITAGTKERRQTLATPITRAVGDVVQAKITAVGTTLPGASLTLRISSELI